MARKQQAKKNKKAYRPDVRHPEVINTIDFFQSALTENKEKVANLTCKMEAAIEAAQKNNAGAGALRPSTRHNTPPGSPTLDRLHKLKLATETINALHKQQEYEGTEGAASTMMNSVRALQLNLSKTFDSARKNKECEGNNYESA